MNKFKWIFWAAVMAMSLSKVAYPKPEIASFEARWPLHEFRVLPPPQVIHFDVPQDALYQFGKGYMWGRCASFMHGRELCVWDEAAI